MANTKILFVDDEANIRMTLPAILEMQGFQVDVAATVADGLKLLNSNQYEALLTDLNIGEPGDGFTLVSAMRRTQPNAATLIITGFPAFETALQAIRSQVDDYIVKPAAIPDLIATLTRSIKQPRKSASAPLLRISAILLQQLPQLFEAWLNMVKKYPSLAEHQLSDEEWLDHLPKVLPTIFESLNQYPTDLDEQIKQTVRMHGETRATQSFQISQIQTEGRLLRRAIYHLLQGHLLSVDISFWITDMANLNDALDTLLVESVGAFLMDRL